MYAKTKELGPIGGACAGHAPPDLPMTIVVLFNMSIGYNGAVYNGSENKEFDCKIFQTENTGNSVETQRSQEGLRLALVFQ